MNYVWTWSSQKRYVGNLLKAQFQRLKWPKLRSYWELKVIDLPTNQNILLAQNIFITCLNYGHWPNIFVCKHVTLGASTHLFCWPTWSSLAKYAQTRGIHPSALFASMIFLSQAWPIWHFCLICMTLGACTQLIIKGKEVVCCLLQVVKVIHWTIHQQEFTPLKVARSSSNYHSPMEILNSILQGKNRHHQKRRRLGRYWKVKVRVSNHICLKQDKTPQHSRNETHDTQGHATNQIQPYRHPKRTQPTSTS